MMSAGHAPNALPQLAKANVNCRILPGHSAEEIRQDLIGVFADPKIAVKYVDDAGSVYERTPVKKAFAPILPPDEILKPLARLANS